MVVLCDAAGSLSGPPAPSGTAPATPPGPPPMPPPAFTGAPSAPGSHHSAPRFQPGSKIIYSASGHGGGVKGTVAKIIREGNYPLAPTLSLIWHPTTACSLPHKPVARVFREGAALCPQLRMPFLHLRHGQHFVIKMPSWDKAVSVLLGAAIIHCRASIAAKGRGNASIFSFPHCKRLAW